MTKSLLQTQEWAEFKASQGWQAENIGDISVLSRKLFLNKSFMYAPEVSWEKYQISKINPPTGGQNKIETYKKKNIFLRIEIIDEYSNKIVSELAELGFVKAFEETQPEYRQIIDISKSEDEILGRMKEKGRYNIRVAQKHGVVVEKSNNISDFYSIFSQTAKRDGFEIRPIKYFKDFLQIFEPKGMAELMLGRYNGKVIAAEIVIYYDGIASYLYGASSNENRNLMAPYLLHWEVMRRAKEKGCVKYDLLAVAPEEEENHKYAGISRFKRQFGGKTVRIVGGWDFIFQPFWYKIFKMAEKFRRN